VICVAAAGLAAVSVAYLQPFAARSGSGPFLLLRMVTPQFVSATTGWVLVEQVESAPARVTHDTVFATTDAGRTWRRLSLPVATARPVEINLVHNELQILVDLFSGASEDFRCLCGADRLHAVQDGGARDGKFVEIALEGFVAGEAQPLNDAHDGRGSCGKTRGHVTYIE